MDQDAKEAILEGLSIWGQFGPSNGWRFFSLPLAIGYTWGYENGKVNTLRIVRSQRDELAEKDKEIVRLTPR